MFRAVRKGNHFYILVRDRIRKDLQLFVLLLLIALKPGKQVYGGKGLFSGIR